MIRALSARGSNGTAPGGVRGVRLAGLVRVSPRAWFVALLAGVAALALCALFASQASADTAGTVHFVRSADSAFNQYTSKPHPRSPGMAAHAHVADDGVVALLR